MSHNGALVWTVERVGHGLQSHWKAIAASLAVAGGVAVLRMCLRRKIVCEPVDYQVDKPQNKLQINHTYIWHNSSSHP